MATNLSRSSRSNRCLNLASHAAMTSTRESGTPGGTCSWQCATTGPRCTTIEFARGRGTGPRTTQPLTSTARNGCSGRWSRHIMSGAAHRVSSRHSPRDRHRLQCRPERRSSEDHNTSCRGNERRQPRPYHVARSTGTSPDAVRVSVSSQQSAEYGLAGQKSELLE